jgi:hypothetical protein
MDVFPRSIPSNWIGGQTGWRQETRQITNLESRSDLIGTRAPVQLLSLLLPLQSARLPLGASLVAVGGSLEQRGRIGGKQPLRQRD